MDEIESIARAKKEIGLTGDFTIECRGGSTVAVLERSGMQLTGEPTNLVLNVKSLEDRSANLAVGGYPRETTQAALTAVIAAPKCDR